MPAKSERNSGQRGELTPKVCTGSEVLGGWITWMACECEAAGWKRRASWGGGAGG